VATTTVPGLFIAGGALIARVGRDFQGRGRTVMSSRRRNAPPIAHGVFFAAYVGISLPVVGAAESCSRAKHPKVTILVFGIAVSVGIAASAISTPGSRDGPGFAGATRVGGVAKMATARPVLTSP